MTARVLVVDDILTNVKLLEARLTAEYYTVISCDNGRDAIDICRRGECDIVLLDVMMPELSGFDVCRILKSNTETLHIPIVLVTALDSASDRVEGLEAGADDFLTKPVSDIALLARVKSLLRLKLLVDELRMRAMTAHDVHMEVLFKRVFAEPTCEDRVVIVDDRPSSADRIRKTLSKSGYDVLVHIDVTSSVDTVIDNNPILVIINLDLSGIDGLRLCSELRTQIATRNVPLLAVSDEGDEKRLSKALELGVNDYVTRPIDPNELIARALTQLRRQRYTAFLQESVQNTMEMAIKDALTGLYNRRYLETHLTNHVKVAGEKATPLSILILDIDYFKAVNDTYGHDGGDEILKEFAKRIADNVRRIDLPCRMGGEEFVVIMPETDRALAQSVAERIREVVAEKTFPIAEQSQQVSITTSIGISCYHGDGDTPELMLKRADLGLYRAKGSGRNCVVISEAA